jgi:hypothetical protein
LSLVHTKLWREALLCKGCKTKGKGKVQGSSSNKGKGKGKGTREEDQRLAKQEGRTKAKGALLQEASRDIFKGLQGFREGLLLYQVHL